ncbi:MAG: flagellar hook-basal body complex protein [Rhodobacteraceae bacterium]|nr:flagellar hook-basal body complex protein [Paracoccaceae bacterium]
MDNTVYTTLTRQSGLMDQMEAIANNIANLSTTGFRREGVMFSEYVQRLDGAEPSLSMATANIRAIDLSPGALNRTGGRYDLAIEGAGFFLLDTPDGQRLTRAGSFTPNADGVIVDAAGNALLDTGGTPVTVPPGAQSVAIGADGTLSADGAPVAQVGLYEPVDANDLSHRSGTGFSARNGIRPATDPGRIRQGYLEDSNVNPITEVARMVDVQRAYEMGQSFLDNEDQRIRGAIQTLGKQE